MRGYLYETTRIKVSSLIREWCDHEAQEIIESAKGDERIHLLMNAGDRLRETRNSGNALIPIVLTAIRNHRMTELSKSGHDDDKQRLELYNHCYLIDSLKHPDEIDTLRKVYKDKILVVSAFSGLEKRKERLCDIIAKSEKSTNNNEFMDRADALISKDAKNPEKRVGQKLSDTFHKADYFLRVGQDLKSDLDRMLELLFGEPYKTPMRDEFFMFEAKANSLRSSDLSRQIGAVITTDTHDIVARGCNEVPTAAGGSYWPDRPEKFDNRDFKKGRDFNNVKKDEVLKELIDFLVCEEIFGSDLLDQDSAEIVNRLIFGDKKNLFKNLRVSNLIEFGRVIHAEMNALMEAARRGLPVQNGVLYSTTFPCHMCARHIIAAGIKRVVYIEPYPKSMAKELFPELISIDSENPIGKDHRGPSFDRVYFVPFEGVAPRIYSSLFTALRRKDASGYTVDWNKTLALPKLASFSTSHLAIELSVAKEVESLPIVTHNDITIEKGIRDVHKSRQDT
ncbi:MAG: hypothetical protein CMN72_03035 [Sphingomonas sp.]|nr:hypothetical protein [Sphingomonas sp.]